MAKTPTAPVEEVVAEAAPVLANWTPPAIVPDDDGYYHDAQWVRIECDWETLKPREGFKPLWAEFDTSLTFAEAQAIPTPFGTPFRDLGPHVCHRVRAWNARMLDPETGKVAPAPPPAEAGLAAFDHVKPDLMIWITFVLKTLHLGGGPNRKNETAASLDGSSGPNDGA
jgi:hypothetical protein